MLECACSAVLLLRALAGTLLCRDGGALKETDLKVKVTPVGAVTSVPGDQCAW